MISINCAEDSEEFDLERLDSNGIIDREESFSHEIPASELLLVYETES